MNSRLQETITADEPDLSRKFQLQNSGGEIRFFPGQIVFQTKSEQSGGVLRQDTALVKKNTGKGIYEKRRIGFHCKKSGIPDLQRSDTITPKCQIDNPGFRRRVQHPGKCPSLRRRC